MSRGFQGRPAENPNNCTDPYAPSFWLGKPGSLVQIRMPDAGIGREGVDNFAVRNLLDGQAVDRSPYLCRTWTFQHQWLTPDVMSVFMEFATRQRGIGPFILIDPQMKNLLSPNQASGTDALHTAEGFAVTGTGESLSSSTAWFQQGERSVAWNFSRAVSTGGVLRLQAPSQLYGWCAPTGKGIAFSGYMTSTLESVDARPRIVFLSSAGVQVGVVTGGVISTVISTGSPFCVTGAMPSNAVYFAPEVVVSGTSLAAFAEDNFNRVTANGWGTATTGQAWNTTGGAAANYSTDGAEAGHSLNSVNVARLSLLPVSWVDGEVYWGKAVMGGGITPLTSPIDLQVVGRYIDANNFYVAELLMQTANTVVLRIRKNVAGVFSTVATSAVLSGVTPGGTAYAIRFRFEGTSLKARAWNRALTEPTTWTLETTDASLAAAGQIGVRTILETGNTNTLPVTFAFDDLIATQIPTPALLLDKLQLEFTDVNACTTWEYGQGQPLVGVRAEGETVPRILRTDMTYVAVEVT